MISDEINTVMLAARSGKAPLELSGHLLMLNWNQQVCFCSRIRSVTSASTTSVVVRPVITCK
jgi:hypothetical protein